MHTFSAYIEYILKPHFAKYNTYIIRNVFQATKIVLPSGTTQGSFETGVDNSQISL